MLAVRSSARKFLRPKFAAAFSTGSDYDLVVVGGGPGGYVAAIKAAQLGLKTACVESRGTLGGTCLNVGCIPSKALLSATHKYHAAQHDFKNVGIEVDGLRIDFAKLMASKDKSVKILTGGIEGLFKKNKVDYIKGFGKIVAKNQVSVALNEGGNKTVSTKNILIATGSEVTPLPPVPVDNEAGKIIDSTGALSLKRIPEHLVVIGGGVIGLEMGSVYGRLGAKITVVEYADKICPTMDFETGREFQKLLKKQGMNFQLGQKVTASKVEGDKVTLTVEPAAGGEATTIECDTVLVATGRRPFTKGLGLEEMGIQTDKFGRIQVDLSNFKTNVDNIFAIGDCIEGAMLAHKAEEEGISCVESIAGGHGHVNYNAIPGVVYTFPEVASVGKTEEELKAANVAYNVGKFPMMANSRARTVGETDGFVKILAAKDDDKILGIHIIASNAGEMISEGVLGLEYGASAEDIGRTCHAHPTLSEAFKEACNAAYDKPINF
ncbi:dihydrolipoyl dehydrogenase [Saprolegnia parasitica CBS 223.65]|uniref:Dihydrolipoyl dehydrogenase n=2 Tax=Saprolegnia parasitica (strain CBS 223.65) TaxID=695850 RepID=A0A067C5L1_SAPPC|nr:dihydrolipoyl dehydrogenase [Saprolegnia parasitica CBS 223.65]KDO24435.1 dihydrolipoyl dehydrogenase [Saprolegnia parasitica CBS 223.65]|eukprot:XP_012204865.1 dihydrolipoyl dehydrogenase [Saprolegnia parasitica CBS 223.65]